MRRVNRLAIAAGLLACAVALSVWTGAVLAEDAATGPADSDSAVRDIQTAQIGIEVPAKDIGVRRGETVSDRERPELDPLGLRAGTFLVFPSLEVDQAYSDNIFATDSNEESDLITRVRPEVRIQSDWNNHELRFDAGADIGRYWDNGDEDFEDFRIRSSGRVDVRRDTNISANAGYQALHERRDSPDDVRGVEPTEYDVFSVGLQGFQRFNRLNLRVGGAADRLDFDDVSTSLGTTINNDDRDRDEIEGYIRGGYEFSPRLEGFLRGAYNVRDYEDDVDDNNIDRDSDGFDIVAGVSIDFSGITFGEFFAGYRTQDYDDPLLDSVDGPIVGGEIIWNVTPLTTVIGTVSREIRESTVRGATGEFASGRFFSTVELEAQHELLRNLLLGANVSFSQDDFEGIDRTDEVYRVGLNARYMLHRNFYLLGGYTFRNRSADVSSDDFTENLFFVRIRAQY